MLVFLLVGAAGAGAYLLKKRSQQICRSACEMAAHAPIVSGWVEEAARDPFLGAAALHGPTNGVFTEYQERARFIASDFSTRLLPEDVSRAFAALSIAGPNSKELVEGLRVLPSLAIGLHCGRLPPPASTDFKETLGKLVVTGALFWAERKAVVVIEKQEFERDRRIYCRGENLLRGLRDVLASAAESCRQAPHGSKLAKACGGGGQTGMGSVDAEISDLEKQKAFNLRKLKQKWLEGVLKRLEC